MSVFIRKAFRLGAFRLNLSRWGLGYSVGVKGLRVGQQANGRRYLYGGRWGVYFKEYLDGTRRERTGTAEGTREQGRTRSGFPIVFILAIAALAFLLLIVGLFMAAGGAGTL